MLENKTELKLLKPSSRTLSPIEVNMYKALNEELSKKSDFDPINVYVLAPDEKMKRYRYLQGIEVIHTAQLYRMPFKHAAFIWKVPSTNSEEFLEESLKIVQKIRDDLPKYHTREMRKKVVNSFKHIRVFDRAMIHKFYDMVTQDDSAENIMLGTN